MPTPPTRPGRAPAGGRADLVRDRLSYRSAPLGLLSTAAVRRVGARLTPGVATGEDVPFVTRLWAGATVAVAASRPGYLVGVDADDRTTLTQRPIADQLASIEAMVAEPWFGELTEEQRTAVAVKLLRVNVFGAVLTRPDPAWWTTTERASLRQVTQAILAAAPAAPRRLSLADRDLLDACLDPAVPAQVLVDRAQARRRHGRPRTLLTRDAAYLLGREAPLRMMAASWWAGRRGARRGSGRGSAG